MAAGDSEPENKLTHGTHQQPGRTHGGIHSPRPQRFGEEIEHVLLTLPNGIIEQDPISYRKTERQC